MRRRYKRKPIQKKSEANGEFLKPTVQTKLNMGKPGDKYEVEADKMADQVVHNTSGDAGVQKKDTSTSSAQEEEVQQKPLAADITPLVQKMEASEEESAQTKLQRKEDEESVQSKGEEEEVQAKGEEEEVQAKGEEEEVQAKGEEEEVQAKCASCEKEGVQKKQEEEVQTKTDANQQKGASIEGGLRNGSGGQKMDAQTKAEMEQGFGADFSNVNIHTDDKAVQMSQDIGAQAFTHGNDIYFNKGKYDPNSKKGKHLLAHELTHTIQQKGIHKSLSKMQPLKIQQKGKECKGTVPFNVEFAKMKKVAFFSTSDCSKIKVILNIKDITSGFVGACTILNVSIDGVSRTKRTIKLNGKRGKVTRKTFTFDMKNAVKHHLILSTPCESAGYYTPLQVKGRIERY